MKKSLVTMFKDHEIQVVSSIIAIVFVTAMAFVALMLRESIATPPYESLTEQDLKKVFATAYLRYREDDGTPYLKVEIHNGTLWWVKKAEFDFDGVRYTVRDPNIFQPLHFGALRCSLKKPPPQPGPGEFSIKILMAFGYPPAEIQFKRHLGIVARGAVKKPTQD
jgi:hypothetical protein